MKNKKLTYFLGILVLGVWGMIIYRLFLARGGDENNGNQIQNTNKKEVFNDYDPPKDTSRLLLNYRDPFGQVKEKDTAQIPVNKLIHKTTNRSPIIQKPGINWSFIKYAGFIHNPGSKRIIAIININGKEQMMGEGEIADQVKLIKNMKDSIKVSYQGKTKFITMNTKGQ